MADEIQTNPIITIQTIEEEVCCDNDHCFSLKNVKLVPFNSSDITDLGAILFVDCDYRLRRGTGTKFVTGYLLVCPVCNVIHLAGFNSVKSTSVKVVGYDNTIGRNLTPEL